MHYDAASRQTLRIDARGFRTSYVYDNDDRLTGRHYPDGTRVTFAYDNASRRTLLNDATGRTTSPFDADGRLTAVINPAGLRLTYAYDAASQRKYLVEPEGARFTYSFDADGRTNYVTNPQAPAGDLELRRRQPCHRHPLRQHNPRRRTSTTTPAGSCAWPTSSSDQHDAVQLLVRPRRRRQPHARRRIERQPRDLELRQDLSVQERAAQRVEQL